jgi:hypothetical protein
MHYFFADGDGVRKLQAALKLDTQPPRARTWSSPCRRTWDCSSDTIEPAPGAVCTSPVQTYLDLSIAGERGAEAADHLRQERLSWPK